MYTFFCLKLTITNLIICQHKQHTYTICNLLKIVTFFVYKLILTELVSLQQSVVQQSQLQMEKRHHHQWRKFRRPHTFDNLVMKIYAPTNSSDTTFKSFIDRSSDYMNCLIEEHRRRYGLICVIVRLSAEFLWKKRRTNCCSLHYAPANCQEQLGF